MNVVEQIQFMFCRLNLHTPLAHFIFLPESNLMAGRGRGRSTLTFNAEALGVGRGQDAPPSCVLDPPPTYPPFLGSKPKLPMNNAEEAYMLAVRKDFINRMKESASYVIKGGKNMDLDWKRLPAELAPNSKSKTRSKKKLKRKMAPNLKFDDVSKKLDKLEEAEKNDGGHDVAKTADDESGDDDEAGEDGGGGGAGKGEDSEIEGDDVDEEMDDGTDYAKDYFDNGEGYLDEEDDNLDEGGIY